MAITANAKKAHRASLNKRVFNVRRDRKMKAVVREVRDLAHAGKADEALAKLPEAYQVIDKAAKRGIIKDNNASRKKSRLAAYLKRAKEGVKA